MDQKRFVANLGGWGQCINRLNARTLSAVASRDHTNLPAATIKELEHGQHSGRFACTTRDQVANNNHWSADLLLPLETLAIEPISAPHQQAKANRNRKEGDGHWPALKP